MCLRLLLQCGIKGVHSGTQLSFIIFFSDVRDCILGKSVSHNFITILKKFSFGSSCLSLVRVSLAALELTLLTRQPPNSEPCLLPPHKFKGYGYDIHNVIHVLPTLQSLVPVETRVGI